MTYVNLFLQIANTFCFIVYHLGHYPDVKEQMLQEINSVFGNNLDRPIEYEDLSKLVYCDAIIKEGIIKKRKIFFCIL